MLCALAAATAVAQLCGVEDDCCAYSQPAANIVNKAISDPWPSATFIEEQMSSRGVSIPSGDFVLAQAIVVARFLQMEDDNAAPCRG